MRALAVALLCGVASGATAETGADPWTLSALYSYSDVAGKLRDWHEGDVELTRRISEDFTLGGRVDVRSRSHGTDSLYTVLTSYKPIRMLELHASGRWSPDPKFSARQMYSAGAEAYVVDHLSLLFDYAWMDFPHGDLQQYQPGATIWFTDASFLTGRYTYGRAYNEQTYTARSVRLTIGKPAGPSVTLSWARGADPERDPGNDPGTMVTLLTRADTYDAFLRLPMCKRLDLLTGFEYENRDHVYIRRSVSIGLITRF